MYEAEGAGRQGMYKASGQATELNIITEEEKEKSLAQPILFSNWRSKNHIPVERGELRDCAKARLKAVHEEELDVLYGLYNKV